MNESITRAAGSGHGQETSPEQMLEMIHSAGRTPRQRTTLYGDVPEERKLRSFGAPELRAIENTPLRKEVRSPRAKRTLVRSPQPTAEVNT